jgi:hypothetical protein
MYVSSPFVAASSNKRDVPSMETQNTNDNYYLNVFFGLTVEKPEGWYAMNNEELRSLVQNVAVPESDDNNSVQQSGSTSSQRLIPLFQFMEYPFGTPNKINPNIVALVENTTGETNTGNDCDGLVNAKKSLQTAELKIISSSECREVDLNGITFSMQELTMNFRNSIIYKQMQYAKNTENGYFTFALTYSNEHSKKQLDNVMNSVRFS